MDLLGTLKKGVMTLFINPLPEGAPAPDFSFHTSTGEELRLSGLRGKWAVLYFYPKDDTGGCTKQACSFRDYSGELAAAGVQVIGVSRDSEGSHARFREKYRLNFPLLADTSGEVSRNYGVALPLLSARVTFVIDPQGVIRRVIQGVDPGDHPRLALEVVGGA